MQFKGGLGVGRAIFCQGVGWACQSLLLIVIPCLVSDCPRVLWFRCTDTSISAGLMNRTVARNLDDLDHESNCELEIFLICFFHELKMPYKWNREIVTGWSFSLLEGSLIPDHVCLPATSTASNKKIFSKHRPSGPILSISRNIRMCVCLSVRHTFFSLRLTVFLPPLPKVKYSNCLVFGILWEK